MRVLVTGSARDLGEALVSALRDANHDVVGLDVIASPLTTHVGSIVDRALVDCCYLRRNWMATSLPSIR